MRTGSAAATGATRQRRCRAARSAGRASSVASVPASGTSSVRAAAWRTDNWVWPWGLLGLCRPDLRRLRTFLSLRDFVFHFLTVLEGAATLHFADVREEILAAV